MPMKPALAAIALALLIAPWSVVNSGPAPVYGFRVIKQYPHEVTAYTQGLEWHGGLLYEGTGGYGESLLKRSKLDNGDTLKQVKLGGRFFGEGITIYDGRVYQLTWRARTGFIYDLKTLSWQDSFKYKGEGWGLTHDDTHLIMSNGSARLQFLDPKSLQVVRTLEVRDGAQPVRRLNELEYVEGEIYANIWTSEKIARISPRDGSVLGWIDLSGLGRDAGWNARENVLNGIAYDAENKRLFVTGKRWNTLFEIELLAPTKSSAPESHGGERKSNP